MTTTFAAKFRQPPSAGWLSSLLAGGLVLLALFVMHTPAQCADPIKIASIYAFSGPAAAYNSSSVAGVRFAVKEINARGGILGRPVDLIEFDNRSTPIGSKVAADSAVQADVAAIIGAAISSHSIAIAKVAQENGIPMITNVSTNPMVTQVGDYIFRACFTDGLQGAVMGHFARNELKAESVVVLFNVSSDYSMGLARTFEDAFVKQGGTVLAKVPYKDRQPHFRDLSARVKAVHPDVVFIAGHFESAGIVQELVHEGVTAIPLGGDGWDEETFYDRGGKKIALGYYTTHWSQDIDTAVSARFVKRYSASGRIFTGTALAYDAVWLLADAIKRAGSIEHNDVRKALAQTSAFEGVTGRLSFNTDGDPLKDVVIMMIRNGRPVYLKRVTPDSRK